MIREGDILTNRPIIGRVKVIDDLGGKEFDVVEISELADEPMYVTNQVYKVRGDYVEPLMIIQKIIEWYKSY